MISYLPEIYPDELVYSWFCRYYVHSGCMTHKMALDDILYNRHNNPSKEFIGHLKPAFQRKIEDIYSMKNLILEHTMFPQYARFLPPERKNKALHELSYGFCDVNNFLSVPPRAEEDKYLKYCPLCSAEDRQKYGERYWHRTHQIRNMKLCHKHNCMLENSTVPAISEQTYTLCPAEEYAIIKEARQTNNELLLSFSKYTVDIFNAPLDFETNIPISTILYRAMKNAGYISSTGKTRFTRRLSEDIRMFYEKLGLGNIATFHQIQRTVLGHSFDFSVVCQIAFYLNIETDNLVSGTIKEKDIVEAIHPQRQEEITDWKSYDNELAPILEEFAKSIYGGTENDIGWPERVSKRIIYQKFDLSDYRLSKLPRCRAIFNKYYESYEENWARRIVWAYNKLKSERKNQTFYWSDIRLLSGVKKKNFDSVITLIKKHTDNETFNAILKIIK